MKSYTLVNPHIEGSISTKFKASSAQDAANLTFEALSKYFSINVPNFSFTLQKGGSDKFYHFNLKEKINSSDKIKFTIKQIEKVNDNVLTKFIKSNQDKQDGGKSRKYKKYIDDDDDEDDDDDDYYYYYKPIVRQQPMYYWSYAPYVYNIKKVYVPTFIPGITPYINIYWDTD